MLATPPPELVSCSKLAQLLYEYWTSTLHTDNIRTIFPKGFDRLSYEERMNLVESFKVVVTDPLKKYLAQVEKEIGMVEGLAKNMNAQLNGPTKVVSPAKPGYPCYCCGKSNRVFKAGQACQECE